ncbi:MAG: OmpL47-type beta-barrel domain-containing protein [Promethearchaeota archaeon]
MEKKNLIILGVLSVVILIFCAAMAIDSSDTTEEGLDKSHLSTSGAGTTYSITIDVSRVDNHIRIYGMDFIPRGGVQVFNLEEGSYSLQGGLVGVFAHFEVNSSGVVSYDSTLEGSVLLGESTPILTVIGHSVTIDATGVDQAICLGHWGYDSFIGWTGPGNTTTFKLAVSGQYRYVLETYNTWWFTSFDVLPTGMVSYDNSQVGIIEGNGTNTVKPVGYSIIVDATGVDQAICLGHWGYNSFIGWTEPGNTTTFKLVAAGQNSRHSYGLETYNTWGFTGFDVLPTGVIFYDNSQVGIIEGNGTNTVKPVGHSITVDATGVDQAIGLGYWRSTESFMGWTGPGNTTTYNIVASGENSRYTYSLWTIFTWEFTSFDVLPTGVISYDNSQEGIIEGNGTNTVKPVGHTITVDATGVDQAIGLGYWRETESFMGWTGPGNTTKYNLVASGENSRYTYSLWTIFTWEFTSFDILPTGAIFYDNSQVGIIEGNGTNTVKPVGHTMTVDATGVDQAIGFGYWASTESFMGWTGPGNTTTYNLVASGENSRYTYGLWTWVTWGFTSFDILPTGAIFYDNSQVGIIEGNGTNTVKPVGHAITIDTSEVDVQIGVQNWAYTESFLGWTEARGLRTYYLVASEQTPHKYSLYANYGNLFIHFTVKASGDITYDEIYEGILKGNNTSILTPIGHPITVDNTQMTKNVSVSWVGDPYHFLGFTEPGEKRTYYLLANTQYTTYPVYVEWGKIGNFRVFSNKSCSPNEFLTPDGTIYITYAYDDEPPLTEITLSGTTGNNGWYTSNVYVDLTATDEGTGVEITEYSFDGSNWIDYSGTILVNAEGIATIFYRSIDEADNIETVKEIDIKIDKTHPDTQLDLSLYYEDLLGDIFVTSSTELSLTVIDSTSGIDTINYRIDGGSWCEYSNVFNLVSNGLYTIEYYSLDIAGNEELVNSITVHVSDLGINSYISKGEYNPISYFDVIFTKSKQTGEYKLVATNPGQIFYIIELVNNWPVPMELLNIEATIPGDFVLKGSTPIHIYLDGLDITGDCIISGTLITLQNVASGSGIKIVIHLDYGLKGTTYISLEEFGMVGYMFETITSGNNGDPLIIDDGLEQTLQHSATLITHQKKTTAIAGYVFDLNGNPIEGAEVQLWTDNTFCGSFITDENGFYYFIDIAEGVYEVRVYFDGILKGMQVATASKNELTQVDFEIIYEQE